MPPLRIELLGEGSGSRVERKENEKVEIGCKVWDSKPAADVIWLRNNVPIVGRSLNYKIKKDYLKKVIRGGLQIIIYLIYITLQKFQ